MIGCLRFESGHGGFAMNRIGFAALASLLFVSPAFAVELDCSCGLLIAPP